MAQEIIDREIGPKMGENFLLYSNAVIEDRALPDILDGLKPVQRRILYSLRELGMDSTKPYRKVAKVVGHALGSYHPHSDSSVAEALVKMAQEFNQRYPLVDGHGNFGSIDGDPAAAMRYIECRLSKVGQQMLSDIDKDTVDSVPNYDESTTEPVVLPGLFPNLLANGSTGIAVAMGTNIPPHNAADLYKAMDLILANELKGLDTDIEDLIKIIQAPDFPTYGEVYDLAQIAEGYRSGRGRVLIRGKYEITDKQIIITELPYRVNKASFVAAVNELRQTVADIKEVRDESDKDGIRVVVDLAKDANGEWTVRQLLKRTDLQTSFGMNLVALNRRRPIQFNLKIALEYFLAHAIDVVSRRIRHELAKLKTREEIVSGFLIAYDNIDKVVKAIRASDNVATAQLELQKQFQLSVNQAKAITDMRLAALTKLSKIELDHEVKTLQEEITAWEKIISCNPNLIAHVRKEMTAMAKLYPEGRRTRINTAGDNGSDEERDSVRDNILVLTYTTGNLIKMVPESEYRSMGRNNRGVKAVNGKSEDAIRFMNTVHSKDDLLLITNTGYCHVLPVFKIPVSNRMQLGKYLSNYLQLKPEEKVISILSRQPKQKGDFLLFTKAGLVKRISVDELSKTFSFTRVIIFRENDELVTACYASTESEPILLTAHGKGMRFSVSSVRTMGRVASGVKAITLIGSDSVIEAIDVSGSAEFLIMTEQGIAKRLRCADFNVKGRGGQGVRTINNKLPDGSVNPKVGPVMGAVKVLDETDDIFLATQHGQVSRFKLSTIRAMGTQAIGVLTVTLQSGDKVVSVTLQAPAKDEEETVVA